jgi:malate synthase
MLDPHVRDLIGALCSDLEQERSRLVTNRSHAAGPKDVSTSESVRGEPARLGVQLLVPPSSLAFIDRSPVDALVVDLDGACPGSRQDILAAHYAIRYALPDITRETGLIIRPRSIARTALYPEADGSVSGAIFDVGVYLYHNAARLCATDRAIVVEATDVRSAGEATWWSRLVVTAEDQLGIPAGSIKLSLGVTHPDTLAHLPPILEALGGRLHHVSGPSDSLLGNGASAWVPLAHRVKSRMVAACHNRGVPVAAPALMNGFGSSDPVAHRRIVETIDRELTAAIAAGYDGLCVADPAAVPAARRIVDQHLPFGNQLHRIPTVPRNTSRKTSAPPLTSRSELEKTFSRLLLYVSSRLDGVGRVLDRSEWVDLRGAGLCLARLREAFRGMVTMEDDAAVTLDSFVDGDISYSSTALSIVRSLLQPDSFDTIESAMEGV